MDEIDPSCRILNVPTLHCHTVKSYHHIPVVLRKMLSSGVSPQITVSSFFWRWWEGLRWRVKPLERWPSYSLSVKQIVLWRFGAASCCCSCCCSCLVPVRSQNCQTLAFRVKGNFTTKEMRLGARGKHNSKNKTNIHNLLENARRSRLDIPPLVRASSYVQPLTWENNLPLCVEHRINIHIKASHRLTVATWSPRWEFIRCYGQEKYAYEWMKETHDCAGGEDDSLVIN